MRIRTLGILVLLGATGLGAAACGESTAAVEPQTALLSVVPEGYAQDVDPGTTIEVTFDHPMDPHATDYMAVHEGDVTGPEVMGSWMMGGDGTGMQFDPDSALDSGTRYTLHLGGGLEDAEGHMVDLETHGMAMGGMWADSAMMGGMMGGQHSHMGSGWQSPENGSYGMVFGFNTAGSAPSALVYVDPPGGATDVDPMADITITFNHAIDSTMVGYAALHEGDVNGPEVPGTWAMSGDRTQLVFTPDSALGTNTMYTIHIGGDMMDEDGHHVDLETHGMTMGGEWVEGSMMHGGGMMGGDHPHTGSGWQHPDNGSYGMVFTFTTAA